MANGAQNVDTPAPAASHSAPRRIRARHTIGLMAILLVESYGHRVRIVSGKLRRHAWLGPDCQRSAASRC